MNTYYTVRRTNFFNGNSLLITKKLNHVNERYYPIQLFKNEYKAWDKAEKLAAKYKAHFFQVEEVVMSNKAYKDYLKFVNNK